MGQAIPYDFRKKIISDRKSGKTYSAIAKELGYSLSGVKKIWYAYQQKGDSSLKPKYFNSGRKSLFDESIRDSIDAIKTGKQGAPFVWSMFNFKHPQLKAPSIRTLQRWWKKQGKGRSRGRPPEKEKKAGLTLATIPGK